MKKQSINTIAKRFFLGNVLAAMFFLSASATQVVQEFYLSTQLKKLKLNT